MKKIRAHELLSSVTHAVEVTRVTFEEMKYVSSTSSTNKKTEIW